MKTHLFSTNQMSLKELFCPYFLALFQPAGYLIHQTKKGESILQHPLEVSMIYSFFHLKDMNQM